MRYLGRALSIALLTASALAAAPSALYGQAMTTITATSVNDGNTPVTGSFCLTPINQYGNPIPVSKSGGGFYEQGHAFCQSLTAGALAGSLTVPNPVTDSSPGHGYQMVIYNDTTHLSSSPLNIFNIGGSSWSLDTYAPATSIPIVNAFTLTYGSGTPASSCAAPALDYRTNAGVTIQYVCQSGAFVAVQSTSPTVTFGSGTPPSSCTAPAFDYRTNGGVTTQSVCISGAYVGLASTTPILAATSGSATGLTAVQAASISGSKTAAPAVPVPTITGSGGASLSGRCSYLLRFRTANGLTDASPISGNISPTAQTVTVALPADPSGTATAWEVYRSNCSQQQSLPYFAAEVTYVTGGTSWVDTVPDTSLVAVSPYALNPGYINETATNPSFLPPTGGTPQLTPSEVNNRSLVGPDIRKAYPNPGLPRIGVYNLLSNSENLSSSTYGPQLDTKTISISGFAAAPITLNHALFTNPYNAIAQNISGGGGITYTPGQAYLFSFFTKIDSPVEQDLQMGNNPAITGQNQWAHGWVDNKVRRKWFYGVATSSTNIDTGSSTPTTAYGSGTTSGLITWETAGKASFSFSTPPELQYFTMDFYIGGLQVEPVPTTPYGIVVMGDSKSQYDCGNWDNAGCSSWTAIASGLMNVPIFDRGISGQTCQQIVARYSTDAHPIVAAGRAKYVVLECGTNGSATAATEEGYITTFVNNVVADGAIPVLVTMQPNSNSLTNPANDIKRWQLNSWMLENCGLATGATGPTTGCPFVVDFSKLDQDPLDSRFIRADPTWQNTTDGVHPQFNARRAEAELFANADFWSFPTPSNYQAVISGTPAVDIPAGAVVVPGANGKLIGAPTSSTLTLCNQGGTLTGVTSCVNINPLGTPHYLPLF